MSSEFQKYRMADEKTPKGLRERGRYLPSKELVDAVNTALACEQPLLLTGEPGTGKTALADSIAAQLGLGEVFEFHTRSDHHARDALYTFESLRRFYDAQIKDTNAPDPSKYVEYGALGKAIRSGERKVVLIDEIDKASRDFPNDLLNVIDRMEFEVAETRQVYKATHRPIVVITSNGERALPAPFLRRCVFHWVEFPNEEELGRIVFERLGNSAPVEAIADAAIRRFSELRKTYGSKLSREPATGELLAWIRALIRLETPVGALEGKQPLPHVGALLKTAEDLELVLKGS